MYTVYITIFHIFQKEEIHASLFLFINDIVYLFNVIARKSKFPFAN